MATVELERKAAGDGAPDGDCSVSLSFTQVGTFKLHIAACNGEEEQFVPVRGSPFYVTSRASEEGAQQLILATDSLAGARARARVV